ncbi:unnamed protein product, partial [Prorocentrum cordatum]
RSCWRSTGSANGSPPSPAARTDYCKSSGRHTVHAGGMTFIAGGGGQDQKRKREDEEREQEKRPAPGRRRRAPPAGNTRRRWRRSCPSTWPPLGRAGPRAGQRTASPTGCGSGDRPRTAQPPRDYPSREKVEQGSLLLARGAGARRKPAHRRSAASGLAWGPARAPRRCAGGGAAAPAGAGKEPVYSPCWQPGRLVICLIFAVAGGGGAAAAGLLGSTVLHRGLRGEAVAAASVLALGAADPAHAFTYNGKEYFDVFYGISPLYWALCAFAIVFYGAVLKNAALKYNTPYGTTTNPDAKPIVTGKFVGMEVETNQEQYNYGAKEYISK